jgi:hypothetical protein
MGPACPTGGLGVGETVEGDLIVGIVTAGNEDQKDRRFETQLAVSGPSFTKPGHVGVQPVVAASDI